MKSRFLFVFLLLALAAGSLSAQDAKKVRVGVILSGAGMMDGTEVSEGVLTMLALERGQATVIYMAPDVPQADVVNHNGGQAAPEQRRVLAESARISRGNVKDIKTVMAADLDALVITGGLGSVKNLSDFLSRGADATVNPDVARLIRDMFAAKKPIGSMCLASATLVKALADKKITVTIGGDSPFVKQLTALGATHKICAVGDIVLDQAHNIVTTPAMMIGPSTSDIEPGITKMINKVLELARK
jgi:enhancing lycopene biosynthesis protein 2